MHRTISVLCYMHKLREGRYRDSLYLTRGREAQIKICLEILKHFHFLTEIQRHRTPRLLTKRDTLCQF